MNGIVASIVHSPMRAMLASLDGTVPAELQRAMTTLSCHLMSAQDIAAGVASFEDGALPELLLVTLSREVSCAEVLQVEALIAAARAVHCPVVLSAPMGAVDGFSRDVWAGCETVLVDPGEVDYAGAIGLAAGTRGQLVSDLARDVDSVRLQRLADEVGRIARTLANLSASAPLPTTTVADVQSRFIGEPVLLDAEPTAAEVRGLIRMRRMRERFFDKELLADPAWDMLLDLMAARLERVQVAVSSLCIAACVPPTTALRWIKNMTDAGLFERVSDPDDGRRIFIRLSDASAAAMSRFFGTMRAANEQAI